MGNIANFECDNHDAGKTKHYLKKEKRGDISVLILSYADKTNKALFIIYTV